MKRIIATAVFSAGLISAIPANAALINLEDKTGPTTFAAACAAVSCPQTVIESTAFGTVTLTGGVILNNTTFLPADETTVYGTENFSSLGLGNPLTITFQNPITNFLVDVLNGVGTTSTFTVADTLGHSSSFAVPPNTSSGVTTIGFATTGTVITVSDAASPFDFFIDNIQFNTGIVCTDRSCQATNVPEPVTFSVFGVGVLGAAALRRRKTKRA